MNTMDSERLAVIDNIRAALESNDSFRKVELHDPVITTEDIKRVIEPFDNKRTRPFSKLRAFAARIIAERMTKNANTDTKIVGEEKLTSIKGGAILTSSHYSVIDSTLPRLVAYKAGKRKKFHIMVQESNIFMNGLFGFLMRNANTLPVSRSPSYMAKNLKPAIKDLLGRGDFILIYPEAEMWFNYKKPRDHRDGAYHYAAEFGVPVIPCFVEMQNLDKTDELGFYKVKRTLHILDPIFPDHTLSVRENRDIMRARDMELRRECYERVYGYPPPEDFVPERDIAGYVG